MNNANNFSLITNQEIGSELELAKRIARLQQHEFELQIQMRKVKKLLDLAYLEKEKFRLKKSSKFDNTI